MAATFLSAGLACLIAAVLGGGLKAFAIEIPVLQSLVRQIILGVLGLLLIVIAFQVPPNETKHVPVSEPDITVAAVPDTISSTVRGYTAVDYRFIEKNGVSVKIETQDAQFFTVTGMALGDPCRGCRILGGGFTVGASRTYSFTDNVYLPPAIVDAARGVGSDAVQLRTVFNGTYGDAGRVTATAVLKIYY